MIPQEDNLKEWYPMTSGSGSTLLDYSTTASNKTITGATWEKNTFNGSYNLRFDGDTDYVTLATSTGYGDQTVSLWVRFDVSTGNNIAYHENDYHVDIWGTSTGNLVSYFNGSYQTVSYGSYVIGQWYHVVASYKSSTGNCEMYVDGKYIGNDTASTGLTQVGVRTLGAINTNAIDGSVADVMVWNSVLTQEEISQLYKSTYRN